MDALSASRSYVGLIDEGSDHTIVELSETTRKIAEQTEKFFPGFSKITHERWELYNKKIRDLTLKVDKEKKAYAFWLPYPLANRVTCLSGIGLFVGGGLLLGFGASTNTFGLFFPGFFGVMFGVIAFPVSRIFIPMEQEGWELTIKIMEKNLSRTQNKQELLDLMEVFAGQVAQFSELWEDFQKNAQETKTKPLFEALKGVLERQVEYRQKILKLVMENSYQEVYRAISEADNPDTPVFGHIAYLFLMDSICSVLKKGPLVDAWNKLTSTSVHEIVEKSGKIEPWKSLGLEYPGKQTDYAHFFEIKMKAKGAMYAEALQRCFKQALTQYMAISDS